MTRSQWPRELLPESPRPSTPDRRTPARSSKSKGRPAWAQVATLGVIAWVLGWLPSQMPSNPQLHALGAAIAPTCTRIAVAFWLAAAALLVVWLPQRLRESSRPDCDYAPEAAAIADEYKIQPIDKIQVTVRVLLWWRPPFWRPRRVVIWLPRGRVTEDPSRRIAARLEPLLGELRKKAWRPRRGKLVLVPGGNAADEDIDIPEVETEPRARAIQVAEGILKTQHLRTSEPEYGEDGKLVAFKLRHPTNVRVAGSEAEKVLSERLDVMLPEAPGQRGWKVNVNPREDYIQVLSRTPLPTKLDHPLIDYASEFEKRFIPFGKSEAGGWMGWNIDPSTQCPHCLLVGPTGAGKTSTIRSIVIGGTRQSGRGANQIEFWGLDPKMIELMGLEGHPGVTRLAYTVEDMAALIEAGHAEMMDRYHWIRRHKVHPSQLGALVIILDEYFVLRALLMRWWKEELGKKGTPPQLRMLNEMLALARSAGIYLCIGIQRPDASNFEEGARDNMRTRVAHASLFPEARRMMWGSEQLGIMHSQGIRGRVMASGDDGIPLETQMFWTPDLDQHPMAREHMSPSDRELADLLRPDPYTPYTITKEGLYVPETTDREISPESVQSQMMDESGEMYRARDLDRGDRIKFDRDGVWELATVDENSYDDGDDGDDELDLSITWDEGGTGEVLGGIDPAEEIYVVDRALTPA